MREPKFINAEQFVAKYGDWYTEEGTENGFIGPIKYLVEQIPVVDIPRWIPVTERLPEEDGRYLITGKRGTVYSLEYEDERWYGGIQPTAWMPLPEPYKGGEEE